VAQRRGLLGKHPGLGCDVAAGEICLAEVINLGIPPGPPRICPLVIGAVMAARRQGWEIRFKEFTDAKTERGALDRACSLSVVFVHRSVLGLPIDSGYLADFCSAAR